MKIYKPKILNNGVIGTGCNLRFFLFLYYNMDEIDKVLFDFCKEEFKKNDKNWIKRNRKINTLSIFYHLY